MAAVSCVLSEDQFLCSICLEVFSEPVTTPCGHNFCKTCINKHWDTSDQYNCPVCKEVFRSRPQIKVNTVVAEMVFEFKNNPQVEDIPVMLSSEPQAAEEGDICCDMCSEPKLKALKSCLVCLLSYCQNHLQAHINIPRLKEHQLIQAIDKLEDRICSQHNRPLELFCRNDSKFICAQCTTSEHKNHDAVLMKNECEVKQAEVRQMIEDRCLKIEEIQRSVEDSQENADKEMQEGIEVYNDLIKCIQQSLENFKQNIKEIHKKTVDKAAELIEKLKSEVLLLEQRRAEMEQFSDDHLHFLQTFTSVKPAPSVNDWSKVAVCSTYERTLTKAVSTLRDHELSQEMEKVFVADLKKFQTYEVNLYLDQWTAHPNLEVSHYNKQVNYTYGKRNHSDNPERFCTELFVFAQQKFSSGKFYFEVGVRMMQNWAVGVAKESVKRKGNLYTEPSDGFWLMEWEYARFWPCKIGGRTAYLKWMPIRIGVFVDYDKGVVSFYNVGKGELIQSLTDCSFTENLLPLFSPRNNTEALRIMPVK